MLLFGCLAVTRRDEDTVLHFSGWNRLGLPRWLDLAKRPLRHETCPYLQGV